MGMPWAKSRSTGIQRGRAPVSEQNIMCSLEAEVSVAPVTRIPHSGSPEQLGTVDDAGFLEIRANCSPNDLMVTNKSQELNLAHELRGCIVGGLMRRGEDSQSLKRATGVQGARIWIPPVSSKNPVSQPG